MSIVATGIESFSNAVRDHMGKKFSDDDIQYHLEQSAYWNIPNVFLMISGYPTETDEDHKKNLLDMEKYSMYAKLGIIELISWCTMHLIPNTPIVSPKSMEYFKFHMPEQHTSFENVNHMEPSASHLWTTPVNKSLSNLVLGCFMDGGFGNEAKKDKTYHHQTRKELKLKRVQILIQRMQERISQVAEITTTPITNSVQTMF